MNTGPAVGVCVALALLLGACSGGGNTGSAPTPASEASTPATAGRIPIAPASVLADVVACPSSPAQTSLAVMNGGVAGLNKRLVPVAARSVRICEYDWVAPADVRLPTLIESAALKAGRARQFEAETNRQARGSAVPTGCTGPGGAEELVFLIFAGDHRRVYLEEVLGACASPIVSNGSFAASPTAGWQIDLERYASMRAAV